MSETRPAASDRDDLLASLRGLGLVPPAVTPTLEPLTGGVASDIWKVTADAQVFVVKRALAKLRVAAEWIVPTGRNASEVGWMKVAGAVVPGCVPEILGHDPAAGLFAMAYLPPDRYPVWKAKLAAGDADVDFAAQVGATLGAIHAATAGDSKIAARFANDSTFHSIRLEPYLEATAHVHPIVADRLMTLSRVTLATRRTLVHGDVSPKNILVGADGPVFLDAECAWYGDPAFDLAFCLNHMLLKCLWVPAATAGFLRCFDALAAAYLPKVSWEALADIEARAAGLLPGLFLARIDGKSPVEYVTAEKDKNHVRATAIPLLQTPPNTLTAIRDAWLRELRP